VEHVGDSMEDVFRGICFVCGFVTRMKVITESFDHNKRLATSELAKLHRESVGFRKGTCSNETLEIKLSYEEVESERR